MSKSHRKNLIDKLHSRRYEERKGVSICLINDFYPSVNKKIRYQVHCDGKYKFSHLYDCANEAIKKYFEILRRR
jgi:hypothetical protein